MARKRKGNPARSETAEKIRERCRVDPLWFAHNTVYTEDPQASEPCRKWPDFKYLNDTMNHIYDNQVTIIEKSRQLSITWELCIVSIQISGFNPSRQGLIQSEKLDKAKALIPRCHYILRRLPAGLLPCTYEVGTDRIVFHFPNGDTSWIVSVPHGPDQVASFSPTYVIFDEASLQTELEAAWSSCAPILRGDPQWNKLIACGTPRGQNYFHALTKIYKKQLIRCHYRQHPGYVEEAQQMGGWNKWKYAKMDLWGYKHRDGTYDESRWLREMEVDYTVSEGKAAFKPPFDRRIHVRPLVANPAYPIIRGIDFGFRHPACAWFQIHPITGQLLILRELCGSHVQLHQFAQRILTISRELLPGCTPYTAPKGPFEDYCDVAGKQRKDDGRTSVQVLNEYGIYPASKRMPPIPRVRLLQRQLTQISDGATHRPGLLIDPSCTTLIDALDGGASFKTGEDGEIMNDKVDFGNFQHIFDGLTYGMGHKFSLGALEGGKRHVTSPE